MGTFDEAKEKEKAYFDRIFSTASDPMSALLKAHLLIEQYLERIIAAKLNKSVKLLKDGRLNFHQKLLLVDSFEIIDNKTYEAIKKLNEIRNDCAHQVEAELTLDVVEVLGNTLRPWFTDLKKNSPGDQNEWLSRILPRIAGKVAGYAHFAEN